LSLIRKGYFSSLPRPKGWKKNIARKICAFQKQSSSFSPFRVGGNEMMNTLSPFKQCHPEPLRSKEMSKGVLRIRPSTFRSPKAHGSG